jgi:hypothetical protein
LAESDLGPVFTEIVQYLQELTTSFGIHLNQTTQRGKRIEESPDGAGSYSIPLLPSTADERRPCQSPEGAGSYRIQKPAVDCQ